MFQHIKIILLITVSVCTLLCSVSDSFARGSTGGDRSNRQTSNTANRINMNRINTERLNSFIAKSHLDEVNKLARENAANASKTHDNNNSHKPSNISNMMNTINNTDVIRINKTNHILITQDGSISIGNRPNKDNNSTIEDPGNAFRRSAKFASNEFIDMGLEELLNENFN